MNASYVDRVPTHCVVLAEPPGEFTNVFMRNMKTELTEEELEKFLYSNITIAIEGGEDPIESLRIGHDKDTNLPWAIISFKSHEVATNIVNNLNLKYSTTINKSATPLYVAIQPKPKSTNNGVCSSHIKVKYGIVIQNLHPSIDNETLHDTFIQFGNILSCKSVPEKEIGFVYFETKEPAQIAVQRVNGKALMNRNVRVSQTSRSPEEHTKFGIIIQNLHPSIDNETLHDTFIQFGNILGCKTTPEKEIGFVYFETEESVQSAIQRVNGKMLKARKVSILQHSEPLKEFNEVFMRNLKMDINEKELENFLNKIINKVEKGNCIENLSVSRDKDTNLPWAIISFKNPEVASYIVDELNLKTDSEINKLGAPLYVAISHSPKDDLAIQLRKMSPQQQMNFLGEKLLKLIIDTSVAERERAIIAKNMLMDLGISEVISLLEGSRENLVLKVNEAIEMLEVRGSTSSTAVGVTPGNVPHRNINAPKGRPSGPAPTRDVKSTPATTDLASRLRGMTLQNQKTVLGVKLYDFICDINPDRAAKITGMLLELRQADVIKLLESPGDLFAKVNEAIKILEDYEAQ